MKPLNKNFAPKSVMPEKVIQFGEGNFLRAFVDWIIWNMDQKTNFNGSVVVVQPIDKGMVEWLNGQDCLYHVNLQGRENGKPVNTLERIDVISRALISLSTPAASWRTSPLQVIPASWFSCCIAVGRPSTVILRRVLSSSPASLSSSMATC